MIIKVQNVKDLAPVVQKPGPVVHSIRVSSLQRLYQILVYDAGCLDNLGLEVSTNLKRAMFST